MVPELPASAVGHALARRPAFTQRAAVLSPAALPALAAGESDPRVITGVAAARGKLAFLFSGQGAQRPDMGESLRVFPVFADAFDHVCRFLNPLLDRPLRAVITGTDQSLLDRADFTQAALFAFEVALFRLLESWGMRPAYLAGHSFGELAAAHVAGMLTIRDAAELVAARGALMRDRPSGGAMVSVEADEGEVLASIAGLEDRLGVAAVNARRSVVLSGAEPEVLAVAADFAARGRRTKRLGLRHATRSPLVEPMLDEFRAVAARLSYQDPRIPVVSGLTGRIAEPGTLSNAEYWVRHVRQPVRFADSVRTLADAGVSLFADLGPSSVLSAPAQETTDRVVAPMAPSVTAAVAKLWGARGRAGPGGDVQRLADPDDVAEQCDTTEENLEHLLKHVGQQTGTSPGLPDFRFAKIYVRHAPDIPYVVGKFRRAFGENTEIRVLNVDLCRSDLLLEVEGVVAMA